MKRSIVMVLVGMIGALVIGVALPASASSVGGALAAGNSVCTDQTGSSNGVTLYGTVTTPTAKVTWSVLAADAPGGPEKQIFQAVTYDVSFTNVTAPHVGTVFYRLCLTNTTRSATSFSHVVAVAQPGGAGSSTGPTTAVLGHEATVCGEAIAKSGYLTASSNAPLTWWVRAFNGDGTLLRQIKPLNVTASAVDMVVGPGAYATLDLCAINHSSTTATASMQFAAA